MPRTRLVAKGPSEPNQDIVTAKKLKKSSPISALFMLNGTLKDSTAVTRSKLCQAEVDMGKKLRSIATFRKKTAKYQKAKKKGKRAKEPTNGPDEEKILAEIRTESKAVFTRITGHNQSAEAISYYADLFYKHMLSRFLQYEDLPEPCLYSPEAESEQTSYFSAKSKAANQQYDSFMLEYARIESDATTIGLTHDAAERVRKVAAYTLSTLIKTHFELQASSPNSVSDMVGPVTQWVLKKAGNFVTSNAKGLKKVLTDFHFALHDAGITLAADGVTQEVRLFAEQDLHLDPAERKSKMHEAVLAKTEVPCSSPLLFLYSHYPTPNSQGYREQITADMIELQVKATTLFDQLRLTQLDISDLIERISQITLYMQSIAIYSASITAGNAFRITAAEFTDIQTKSRDYFMETKRYLKNTPTITTQIIDQVENMFSSILSSLGAGLNMFRVSSPSTISGRRSGVHTPPRPIEELLGGGAAATPAQPATEPKKKVNPPRKPKRVTPPKKPFNVCLEEALYETFSGSLTRSGEDGHYQLTEGGNTTQLMRLKKGAARGFQLILGDFSITRILAKHNREKDPAYATRTAEAIAMAVNDLHTVHQSWLALPKKTGQTAKQSLANLTQHQQHLALCQQIADLETEQEAMRAAYEQEQVQLQQLMTGQLTAAQDTFKQSWKPDPELFTAVAEQQKLLADAETQLTPEQVKLLYNQLRQTTHIVKEQASIFLTTLKDGAAAVDVDELNKNIQRKTTYLIQLIQHPQATLAIQSALLTVLSAHFQSYYRDTQELPIFIDKLTQCLKQLSSAFTTNSTIQQLTKLLERAQEKMSAAIAASAEQDELPEEEEVAVEADAAIDGAPAKEEPPKAPPAKEAVKPLATPPVNPWKVEITQPKKEQPQDPQLQYVVIPPNRKTPIEKEELGCKFHAAHQGNSGPTWHKLVAVVSWMERYGIKIYLKGSAGLDLARILPSRFKHSDLDLVAFITHQQTGDFQLALGKISLCSPCLFNPPSCYTFPDGSCTSMTYSEQTPGTELDFSVQIRAGIWGPQDYLAKSDHRTTFASLTELIYSAPASGYQLPQLCVGNSHRLIPSASPKNSPQVLADNAYLIYAAFTWKRTVSALVHVIKCAVKAESVDTALPLLARLATRVADYEYHQARETIERRLPRLYWQKLGAASKSIPLLADLFPAEGGGGGGGAAHLNVPS
jgi:hypothetical protein